MHTRQISLYFCMFQIKKFQVHLYAKKYQSGKIHWKPPLSKSSWGLRVWKPHDAFLGSNFFVQRLEFMIHIIDSTNWMT